MEYESSTRARRASSARVGWCGQRGVSDQRALDVALAGATRRESVAVTRQNMYTLKCGTNLSDLSPKTQVVLLR